MRKIQQDNQDIQLPFGTNGLPGYALEAQNTVVVPSILSNPFFKDFNLLKISKQLKGLRSNPDLQNILIPFEILTGITIELDDLEYIQLHLTDTLSKKHLLLVQPVTDGENLKVQVLNLGLKDVKIEVGTLIATALIQRAIQ